ncbi:hypothetical protein [Streptococcus sobrinus]|uniref:hypothetical protein n=1 Tax=Streptococcus sobrinus TaxID=1310 RepID=UPI00031CB6D3|nr:hypothetical protein [Streptococcus sobrinus]
MNNDLLIEEPKSKINIDSIIFKSIKATATLWVLSIFFLMIYCITLVPTTVKNKDIYYISKTDLNAKKIYLSKSVDNRVRRFVAKHYVIDYPSEKMISRVSDSDFKKIYGENYNPLEDRRADFAYYTPQKGLKFLSNNEAKKIHFSDEDPVDWAIKQIKLWMILMTAGLIFLLRLGSATFKKKGRDDNKYQGVPVDQEVEELIILSDEEENNDKAFY